MLGITENETRVIDFIFIALLPVLLRCLSRSRAKAEIRIFYLLGDLGLKGRRFWVSAGGSGAVKQASVGLLVS